jgi:hypothetical protein
MEEIAEGDHARDSRAARNGPPSRSPEDESSGKVTVTFKDREFGKTADPTGGVSATPWTAGRA